MIMDLRGGLGPDRLLDVWLCEPPAWGAAFRAVNFKWVIHDDYIERHITSWTSDEEVGRS